MAGIQGILKIMAVLLLLGTPMPLIADGTNSVVVMLGDSTTLCTRNNPGAKLTELVQAYLTQTRHLQATVVNSGVGSDTAKGGYGRLQKAVFAHNPDVVTISFGLNDTGLHTPEEFRDWLEKIILAIREKTRAKILLVTSTPFKNTHFWWKKFADKGGLDEYMDANICEQTRNLAKKYNLPFCDLHAYFKDKFKEDPALVDKVIMPDSVHVTDDGNRLSAEYLAPMIADLIGGLNTTGKK
jgi:lysophospholipase L1-like esterase